MRQTVAIVGVGLIGGSIGRALRQQKRARVLGLGRRLKTLRQALRVGAVDAISTDLSRVREADWVIVCTPVDTLLPMLKRLRPYLKAGAWVTDVGSVKGLVVEGMRKILAGAPVHFAGSHPLFGSHLIGVRASHASLLKGATCVVVPAGSGPVLPLVRFWSRLGLRPVVMTAKAHDEALALTSHLPHLIAHALVHCVVQRRDRQALTRLMAGSFRDTTRVASSDPSQWAQILGGNRRAVRAATVRFTRQLSQLARQMGTRRLAPALSRSQKFRQPLFAGRP